MVIVIDNDGGQILPQINISAEDSVVEGEEITFVLRATTIDNVPLTADLSISLRITQTGSFLAKDAGTRDVMIPMTIGFKDLVEQTIWLENRAGGGMITAEIQEDSTSTPTYSRGSEFRHVVDVELFTGPLVSINALTSSIVAGTLAIFNISVSTPNETSTTDVLINVTQTLDIIQWRIPSGVSIPAGQNSRQLQIPTRKNMELPEDMDVSITITFRESSDYRFRADSEAAVTVNNSVTEESGPRISVAEIAVNAILNYNPSTTEEFESASFGESSQSIVSIQAINQVVAEGQPIQLLISTHVVTSSNLIVNLNINGGQSFVNLTSPNQQVAISRGQSNTPYTLATIDDERAEDDETMIVSIAEGEGYSIANSPSNQASVLISDANDRNQYNERLSAANRILIPELMATTGVQSYQTMSNRVQMAFNNEEQFLFEIGGQSNPTEILQTKWTIPE